MIENSVSPRSSERNFYTAMTVAMLLTVIVGFGRTFFLRPMFPEASVFAAPEPVFYIHGVLFTAWLVLLIGQAIFIRSGNVRMHRTAGKYGGMLAASIVVMGLYAGLIAATRPDGFMGVPVPPLQFLVVPFFAVIMFGLFVAWAIARRSDPQSHKRLMLFATINILEAAIARIPLAIIQDNFPASFYLAADLFILAIVVWDLVSMKKLHRITIIATVLTIAVQVGRFMIMETEAWLRFANWMIGLIS